MIICWKEIHKNALIMLTISMNIQQEERKKITHLNFKLNYKYICKCFEKYAGVDE